MADREKVIAGFEDSLANNGCGFMDGIGELFAVSGEDLQNAITLLKAQEQRVMTLEELVAWQKQPIMARDPIYVEYREGKGFGAPHWAMDNFGFNVASCRDNYRAGVYGILLRCWTSRPTDEQREATPWTKR